jgi:septal ring factor EnvC (AmiA/AmiB activator)
MMFVSLLTPCAFQENKRLTAALKATTEKLSTQESNTKQLAATLKAKNGEIIKLSKALRSVENDLGENGQIAQTCNKIETNLVR